MMATSSAARETTAARKQHEPWSTSMSTKIKLALAVALLPAIALAADPVEMQITGKAPTAPSVVVRYGDLNLSTQDGQRLLHNRLNNAAWHVCVDMITPAVGIQSALCREQLVQAAEADVSRMRFAGIQEVSILR
jgi:UrcA family protein